MERWHASIAQSGHRQVQKLSVDESILMGSLKFTRRLACVKKASTLPGLKRELHWNIFTDADFNNLFNTNGQMSPCCLSSHNALHARQLKSAVYLEMLSLEAVESWLSMW